MGNHGKMLSGPYDKVLFGEVHEVRESIKKPRFIAKRVAEIKIAKVSKSMKAKKVSKSSKELNHNHTKHL